ncbi:MAG: tetratricopeptide repeat protein [Gemmataceae bacterium]
MKPPQNDGKQTSSDIDPTKERLLREIETLRQQQKLFDAESLCEKLLHIDPDHAHTWYTLAIIDHSQQRYQQALERIGRALAIHPDEAKYQTFQGSVLVALGRVSEALICYLRAVELEPSNGLAFYNLGWTYYTLNQRDAAQRAYEQATELAPTNPKIWNNLGNVYRDAQDFVRAHRCYDQALKVNPKYATAYLNKGTAYYKSGDFDSAQTFFDRAIQINPNHFEARIHRSCVNLLNGKFEQGWKEYEYRWLRPGHSKPSVSHLEWDGTPLAGRTLLLYSEQGMGDTIHFARYAKLIKQSHKTRIVLTCQVPLVSLLSRCPGIDVCVPKGQPLPAFDVHLGLLSLPRLLQTEADTIPGEVPYLFAKSDRIGYWRNQLESISAKKIGILWQGSLDFPGDQQRSLKLQQFRRIAEIPNVQLISLQMIHGTEQLEAWNGPNILDVTKQIDRHQGFEELAAVLMNLDLLITCDTAIAHLAGALAVPVWVCIPFVPDWRWQLEREDSPWYRTMRLLRQSTLGDWNSVFQKITKTLTQGETQTDAISSTLARPSSGIPTTSSESGPTKQELLREITTQRKAKRLPETERLCHELLKIDPQHAATWHTLAVIDHSQHRYQKALESANRAVRIHPNEAKYQTFKGLVLVALGRVSEALGCYRRAVELQPSKGDCAYNLGWAHQHLGQWDAAQTAYERATNLAPMDPKVWNNLGNVYKEKKDLTRAHQCFDRALELNPNYSIARMNRSLLYLLLGRFAEGWDEYESRWLKPGNPKPPLPHPEWDGTPLAGRTLLLYSEQGMGDTIHFARYAKLIKHSHQTKIVLTSQAPLGSLLSRCPGIDVCVPKGQPLPAFDVHLGLLSLPRLLQTEADTIPGEVPYLFAKSDRIGYWRNQLESISAKKIGILWQGSPDFPGDPQRSLKLQQFRRIAEIPNVQLISLQMIHGTEQLEAWNGPNILDVTKQIDSNQGFEELAAVLMNLDLVISCDTVIAHLAGALAVPVWVCIPFVPDWRWQLEREDSPWYPTMRLFRQERVGDWESVVSKMIKKLNVNEWE